MTAYGPYTEATLIYEPTYSYYIPVVESTSMIKIINDMYPEIYKVMHAANYIKKYAAESYKNTFFLSTNFQYSPDINAVEYCKSCTIPRCIDLRALDSSNEILLNTELDHILIKKSNDKLYANGRQILNSIICSNGIIYVTS